MTLHEYIEGLKNKSVAIIGLGVSNLPLARRLLKDGVSVTVCDKRTMEQLGTVGEELSAMGCRFRLGADYLEGLSEDVIFRTPGLHPYTRQLADAKARGALLTSEMEAFFAVCPCHILAVTGSDGKTTTTTIISELLKAAGYTVHLGGNIGKPLLTEADEMHPDDWAVLELSSFQLHSMKGCPEISVVTNVAPNHLDIHPSYEDYQIAKKQIFAEHTGKNILVVNADNEITKAFGEEAKSTLRSFSRKGAVENGVYLRDGIVYRARNGKTAEILAADEIRIPGLHNVENYMAAFSATADLVSDEVCRSVAREFPGVAHRLEMLRTLRGVTYCNDSIASSPSRTTAGLYALRRKPILIAGGYDKHIPFDSLGDVICERVKALYLTGFTAEKIRTAVTASEKYDPEKLPITVIDDFTEAVLAASASAEEGDLVLLSPACASFDHFKNFEERGNLFRSIVMNLE